MIELLTPKTFYDYELIDCGDFEKLERFGDYVTIRPEPQAVWSRELSYKEWEIQAHVRFRPTSSSAGTWMRIKQMPDRWSLKYNVGCQMSDDQSPKEKISPSSVIGHPSSININFRLALTSFKHIGIFPEQAVNWDYIYESIAAMRTPGPKVLNLFAYTGGASLAAKAAGADVTHVDSIKQVVTWARENMELSELKDIRWVVEDALKFVKREVKRGNKYNGIILDPPAYGHGPNGEKWKLEENINEMIKEVVQLLDEKEHFFILNTYSLGFSSIIIENLLKNALPFKADLNTGELYLKSTAGPKLPLGVFGRFRSP